MGQQAPRDGPFLKMEISAINASPDAEAVKSRLCELRDQLKKQDMDAVKLSVQELGSESQPKFTMEVMAPYLFLHESNDPVLTSQDALSILTFLVTSDASAYLKPASRSTLR